MPGELGCDGQPPTSAKLVTLVEHSGCYGTCPIYTIAVYADGTVDYHGARFVAVQGRRVTHVDAAQVAELVRDLDAMRFSSLPDYPSPRYTDGPEVTVQYGLALVREEIGDPAIPSALTALEERLDRLAGVEPSPGADRWRRDCLEPATLVDSRILQQTEAGGELRLVVGIGSGMGITRDWQAHLLAADTNQLLGGAATIVEINSRATTVTTPATPEAKRATAVRFSQPSR